MKGKSTNYRNRMVRIKERRDERTYNPPRDRRAARAPDPPPPSRDRAFRYPWW